MDSGLKKLTSVVNLSTNSYDVYVGRPSPYGNKWSTKPSRYPDTIIVSAKKEAIQRYTEWLLASANLLKFLAPLRGKRLGCFCKTGLPNRLECHGQVLAFLADHGVAFTVDEILNGAKAY